MYMHRNLQSSTMNSLRLVLSVQYMLIDTRTWRRLSMHLLIYSQRELFTSCAGNKSSITTVNHTNFTGTCST